MQNYDMEKVLPHSHPMIFIDDILDYSLEEHSVSTIVKIYEDKIFFDKSLNGIPPIVGIEYMAQTLGCYSYFRNGMKPPKIGFLLGTRLYKNHLPLFENGKTYKVRAKELFSDNELVSFECLIYNGDEVGAEAVINAYLPADDLNFTGMINE